MFGSDNAVVNMKIKELEDSLNVLRKRFDDQKMEEISFKEGPSPIIFVEMALPMFPVVSRRVKAIMDYLGIEEKTISGTAEHHVMVKKNKKVIK